MASSIQVFVQVALLFCVVTTSMGGVTDWQKSFSELENKVNQIIEQFEKRLEQLEVKCEVDKLLERTRRQEGCTCPPGPKGTRGIPGLDGINGTKGEKGDPGPHGEKGEKGEIGLPGSPGPQGPQGLKGTKGERGETGQPGLDGQNGEPGLKGDTGVSGLNGTKGERGGTGRPGNDGQKGEPGLKGDTGVSGLNGTKGKHGEKGQPGNDGQQGPQGLKGTKGELGENGPQGLVGQKGEPGLKGVEGRRGNRGKSGVPGLNGTKGEHGEKGQPGNDGQKGEPGLKGESGVPGHHGQKGEPGLKGLAGVSGLNGTKGEQGERGQPGNDGQKGPDPTPRDCREAYLNGYRKDGVYTIDPGCGQLFNAFCDMKNGGWTVFQSRMDGSVDFYRNWADYVAGFGQLKGEHWLGLEKLVCLTTRRPRTELRVDLADYEGNYKYAQYSFFSVGNSETNYRLNIAGYTGNAGDSLAYSNGMQFSTKDRDNDQHSRNCASSSYRYGAWWYKDCTESNLNGLYRSGQDSVQGVYWYHFLDNHTSLKLAQMKLRFRD